MAEFNVVQLTNDYVFIAKLLNLSFTSSLIVSFMKMREKIYLNVLMNLQLYHLMHLLTVSVLLCHVLMGT